MKYVNVTRKFGSFLALENLNLNLFTNEIYCLLGHNGAGKTTTANLLTGLIKPSEGNIYIYDEQSDKYINLRNDLNQARLIIGLC